MLEPPTAARAAPKAATPANGVNGRARSDEELVARARGGDAVAFETIMRRHNRLLFRAARGVVADDAEAQDVVQEAYLRAFSHLASYRGDAALGTWLARIAINVALDSLRSKGRTVQMDDSDDSIDEPSPEHFMSAHAPQGESPDAAAERGQMRELLHAAIDRLPPIYRSVFILRAVEEASVDETAFCLQVSDAVVKTRYLRARSMLRDMIGAQVEAEAPAVFQFAGARCEAVVNHVLAELSRRRLTTSS
jgi:RNA polymerase sigma factor (sigma-70 family)